MSVLYAATWVASPRQSLLTSEKMKITMAVDAPIRLKDNFAPLFASAGFLSLSVGVRGSV